MEKVEVPLNYLYEYIKEKSIHRISDLSYAVNLLSDKFSNNKDQIIRVLMDAIESNIDVKVESINKRYGYTNINKSYKSVK